jgi:hypothetical protein
MEAGTENLDVQKPLWLLQRLHRRKQGPSHVTHLGDTPFHFKDVQTIPELGRLQLLEDLSGASYPHQDLLQLSS